MSPATHTTRLLLGSVLIVSTLLLGAPQRPLDASHGSAPQSAWSVAAEHLDRQSPILVGWSGAHLGQPMPHFDLDGDVSAFVFPVEKDSTDVGYIVVSSTSTSNQVVEFGEGAAPYRRSRQEAREVAARDGLALLESTPLYLGALSHFYQMSQDSSTQLYEMTAGRLADHNEWDQWTASSTEPPEREAEREMERQPSSAAAAAANTAFRFEIVPGVPDYNQGFYSYVPLCHMGCSPTAAGTVIGYWATQRTGYGNLLPSGGADEMIRALRELMGTWCCCLNNDDTVRDCRTSDIEQYGCTVALEESGRSPVASGMVDYATSRGYEFTARWVDHPDFEHMTTEIDAWRPAYISISNGTTSQDPEYPHPAYGDHAVALVGYQVGYPDGQNGDPRWLVVHDNGEKTDENVWIRFDAGAYSKLLMVAFGPATSPPPLPPPPGPPPCVPRADFQHVESFHDGTIVQPGQSMDKWWRVRNSGTCDWSGYQLMFESGEQMGGPSSVAIPNTPAGGTVDIHVSMVAPTSGGEHTGYWRIISSQGNWVQDGRLWIKVNVAGSTTSDHILSFTADPPSPSSADIVRLHARVNWWPEFRAMRVRVGSQTIETSAVDYVFEWNTSNEPRGNHAAGLEVATHTDTSWSNPERRTMVYTLEGEPAPSNHAPNRPTLVSPYDWYVTVGAPPQLCAQGQGDPDGDPVNEYYFDVRGHDLWNSGWTTSSCVTPSGLGYWTYEWSVKVRDSHGAESEWSDNWHFSIRSDTITITDLHFDPASPSAATQVKIYSCTDGLAGLGITQRTEVNTAADGSDSGEWKIIKELGVPCYTEIDVPVWQTLPFENGDHLVRVLARGPDDTQWQGASIRYATYHLNHRRPASPDLVAPSHNSWVNSRTVTFRWTQAIRAQSYTLRVSPNPNPDTNPVVDQTLPAGTTSYQITFDQDYQDLYWRVYANNDQGYTGPGVWHFGIDRTTPACAVAPLDPVVAYNVFPVNWSGSDNPSAVRTYNIQVRDGPRANWADWLTDVPSETTVSLFDGQPGHTYYFRCRATDLADNTGAYATGDGDTHTLVDPTSVPPPPWWDSSYAQKRDLTILNSMNISLPSGYPVRLHFDSNTNPTAAELYDASLSTPKCNDLRIVYNNQTQLDRAVQGCSASSIDVFFRTQASIPPLTADQAGYQLYYGHAGAGTPPGSYGTVFYPSVDSHTRAALYFQEGGGSVAYDSSGYANNGTFPGDITWSTGKWGHSLLFPGNDDINGGVDLGRRSSLNLPQITFEGWFQNDNPTAYDHLFSQRESYPLLKFVLSHVGTRLILDYWDDLAHGMHEYFLETPGYTPDSGWHHYALTYDGSTVRIYYDGVQKASAPFTGFSTAELKTEIGASQGVHRPLGRFQNVRISNIARSSSDFWYASFAQITTEPSLAAGVALTPPASGTPDLVLESLNAYPAGPGLEGGMIVQAVLTNEGDRATENGFFTDIYADHLPTGAGDYTGSLHFWIANPIQPGSTMTLTTVVTGIQPQLSMAGSDVSIAESSTTLYGQVDSTGVVSEPDDQNNISGGTEICIASDDAYESDDSYLEAQPFLGPQTHNVGKLADQDWVSVEAEEGQRYILATSNLGPNADTYLYLYDTDGLTLLAANDDYGGTLASRIVWECPATGTYYAAVKHWNPNVSGCGTTYDLSVSEQHAWFFPLALKLAGFTSPLGSAAPDATATPVEPATPSPSFTPTATVARAPSPAPTITATIAVTYTATPTSTPSPTQVQEVEPEPTSTPTENPPEGAVPTPTEMPTPSGGEEEGSPS